MKTVSLPFVQSYIDQHGKERHYFRRGRGRKARLPGAPDSAEYLAAYQSALYGTPVPVPLKRAKEGSVEALVRLYLGSAEFGQLADLTRREMRYRLERIRHKYGALIVRGIRRRHLKKIQDDMAATPAEANTNIRIWKLLLNFAVEREFDDIEASVAARIKLLKVGEWRDWSDEEHAAFEAKWVSGTVERLAYSLLLYTGQRVRDVAKMTELDFAQGSIKAVQQKTMARVDVPAHEALVVELAVRKVKHIKMLLADQGGKPFTAARLGVFMARAIADAKLPSECVTHGLRKSAARHLAEMGCTEDEIMAVTGHKTSSMIRKYVKGASKKKMATAAMLKWRKKGETPPNVTS